MVLWLVEGWGRNSEEGNDVGTKLDKCGKSNDLLSLDFRSYKGLWDLT